MAGQSRHTTAPNTAETEVGMNTPETDQYGNRYWYNSQGQLHRKDGPACEYSNGTRAWWVADQRHREQGPAIERADGSRAWYVRGRLHRTDGPAVEQANGTREWWLNGRRHRVDGPAVENSDGTREWWLNGLFLTFERWLKETTASPQLLTLLRLRWT
jgi:hypothetical protein